MDFPYGETEIAYLRARDLKLGAAMDRIGPIHREVDPDLFSSVIHHIIGQQVSMAAQRTVWQRLQAAAGTLVPETVAAMPAEALQALGMTRRRALYILEFARKVASGDFDLDALAEMEDREVLARLTSLRGVGPWTAEMLLIFGLRRPDVVSWGDLAILRGMRMLYRKRSIDQRTFQPLRHHCQPVPLGHRLRRPAGADGPWRRTETGQKTGAAHMTDRQRWQAVLDNDRRYDGAFFYGVASTGIFCRPSCPSRPPRRDRVRFFPTADAALAAGFRPCKRCRPDLTDFSPGQDVAAEAMALLHRHFRDQAALSAALNGLGLSRRRLAALFQAAYGTTLHGCLGTLRVTEACRLLRETDQPVAQIAGEAGFDSLSAFYRAFRSGTGQSPLAYRRSAHSAPDKSSGPC